MYMNTCICVCMYVCMCTCMDEPTHFFSPPSRCHVAYLSTASADAGLASGMLTRVSGADEGGTCHTTIANSTHAVATAATGRPDGCILVLFWIPRFLDFKPSHTVCYAQ